VTNIVQLNGVGPSKARRDLARWLREIADLMEADLLETEPHAALIVLTGTERHEMASAGYSEGGDGFDGAVNAAWSIGTAHYERVGGAFAMRNHPRYGRPFRSDNVAQFSLPKKKTDVPTA
jgi:hypothetical protein